MKATGSKWLNKIQPIYIMCKKYWCLKKNAKNKIDKMDVLRDRYNHSTNESSKTDKSLRV